MGGAGGSGKDAAGGTAKGKGAAGGAGGAGGAAKDSSLILGGTVRAKRFGFAKGKRTEPPLCPAQFRLDLGCDAVAAVLGAAKSPLPPPLAAAALVTALRRVFLEELPGRALTFAGTYKTDASEMGEDLVINQTIHLLPIAQDTTLGMELRLNVTNPSDKRLTVYSGDLVAVGKRATPLGAVINPTFVLAMLHPGEFLKIDGITVVSGTPAKNDRFAAVPRAGVSPLGIPLAPEPLVQAGAQTAPTAEEARSKLRDLAAEPYIGGELAGRLLAFADGTDRAAEDAIAVLTVQAGAPLVSLADTSRFRASVETAATGYRLTGTAASVRKGEEDVCRHHCLAAARLVRDALQAFGREVTRLKAGDDDDTRGLSLDAPILLPGAVRSDGTRAPARTRLQVVAEGFSETVCGLIRVFAFGGAGASATVDARALVHEGRPYLVVDTPGGVPACLDVLERATRLAGAAFDALEAALRKARTGPFHADEVVTALNAGL